MSSIRTLAALLPLAGALAFVAPQPAAAQSLFGAEDVDQSKFVVVAAPIGDGSRAQLNIYEQRSDARPCYAVQGSNPAVVDPLLSTFDFTGICNRYIDGNGYSLRIGDQDLGTVYRLSVVKESGDTLLMALPTKPGAGPEMVVARPVKREQEIAEVKGLIEGHAERTRSARALELLADWPTAVRKIIRVIAREKYALEQAEQKHEDADGVMA
jgi:hypothetical protein